MLGVAHVGFGQPGPLLREAAPEALRGIPTCSDACRAQAGQVVTRGSLHFFLEGAPRWQGSAARQAPLGEIAEAYERSPDETLARLNGGFAIAIYDEREKSLALAVDRMGIATLSWSKRDSVIAFATSSYAAALLLNQRPPVDSQRLYDYFFFHMVPSPGSVFVNVHKLPPASVATITNPSVSYRRYWQPDFHSDREDADAIELALELRTRLQDAVRCRFEEGVTGAFLSGGLDSSTVAGVAAGASDERIRTFSIGFGVPEYDELEYARIAAKHFGFDAREYVVTPDDVVDALGIVAATYDEPFGNSSAVPTYLCARFARESGIVRLLAGDGGDELFAGNERYAKQMLFERYQLLPDTFRQPISSLVSSRIPEDHPVALLRKLRSYVDQATVPLPERFETWNFVYREGARMMFDPGFVESIDPTAPLRQMACVFQQADADDLLDRMLFYDWKFTLADNDLRKVAQMCAAAGVEVEFPMLDNSVVDLSTRVPSQLKMRGRRLRSFYKSAMEGFLPREILTKEKHGFGLPFGVWLKTHDALQDLAFSALRDLKQRNIVRAKFIDQLIQDHVSGDPGYYGYVIWDLVLLEQWLKSRPLDITNSW